MKLPTGLITYKRYFKAAIANLPWWCRRIISLVISYYGWKLASSGAESQSPSYCYSVWHRHLRTAQQNGLRGTPHTVVELGPGNSLGVGLAALLSGADEYYAFDRVRMTGLQQNMRMLDELEILFQAHHQTVPHARCDAIRNALTQTGETGAVKIVYVAPWDGRPSDHLQPNSVDMILSHAVLEYVPLDETYALFQQWLKPGGIMSHQIDFTCHTLAREWNGHWTYPATTWRYLEGTRPYRLNRQPHSAHINQLKRHGFRIACDMQVTDESGIRRKQLAPEFVNVTDEDLATRSAFIQAIK